MPTPRVLIVEDEEHVRELLNELLTLWGYDTETAATGTEGLERLSRDRYDLILTDHSMPGVTGLELVRAVRKDDSSVGIIVLTAKGAEVQPHRQGLDFTLISKPFEVDRLETAIREVLGAPA